MNTTEVVVGRIGKAHGLRGDVAVEPRTDEPDRRFVVGARLRTRAPADRRADRSAPASGALPSSLTVVRSRWHSGRLLLAFDGAADRAAVEALRGLLLVVDVGLDDQPEDPEEFYDHQLVGLAVVTDDGRAVGELEQVVHGPGQDLLSIRSEAGREILVPFVAALVPEVDVDAGRIVVADVPGLLADVED